MSYGTGRQREACLRVRLGIRYVLIKNVGTYSWSIKW